MANLRYGVIGIGSMGRHHVRNIRECEGIDLVAIADPGGDQFGIADGLPVLPDVEALIEADIDAAVVAVPTIFHEETALKLAHAGVHTLVEKPLAQDVETGERIVAAFEKAGLVGAVGYVERCNPALLEMKRRIAEGQLGEIYHVSTRRQSPFPARISDVGVVKDLATHDVDLTAWVAGADYQTLSAFTAFCAERQTEDMVNIVAKLENGIMVNNLVNWLSPFKDRNVVVIGEKGALTADTLMGNLTYHRNGSIPIEWNQVAHFRGVSEGEIIQYELRHREPLRVEHEYFRDAILGKSSNHVSMKEALQALRVCETILESAKTGETLSIR